MIDDQSPSTISEFPSAENDLRLAMIQHDIGLLRDLDICFPACVYSYDRSTHTAVVMPLVKQGFYNGKWIYLRRKTFSVSVRNIQCGGFTIDFPVYVGDTGWVFSSDRDTQLIKQMGALTNSVLEKDRPTSILEDDYQQNPNQPSLHSFTNGFFIPDNWGEWETHRYKDSKGVAVGSSLYIGSSIDTNDDKVDTGKKKFQKGKAYEKKVTSSLTMLPSGGIRLASSAPTLNEEEEEMPEKNICLSIVEKKGSLEASVDDTILKSSSALGVDAEDGVIIKQDTDIILDNQGEPISEEDKEKYNEDFINKAKRLRKNFLCSINSGAFSLRVTEVKFDPVTNKSIDDEPPNIISFQFSEGKLNVQVSNDVNINVGGVTNIRSEKEVNIQAKGKTNISTQEDINIKSAKDVNVAAQNARVVAKKDASVAAQTVSASATKEINIAAGQTLNVGAVDTTNINGGKMVSVVGGQGIEVAGTMVSVKGRQVEIQAAEKIDLNAKEESKPINITGRLLLNGQGFQVGEDGSWKVPEE